MGRKRRNRRTKQESKQRNQYVGEAEKTLDEILGKHNSESAYDVDIFGREYKTAVAPAQTATTHPRTFKYVNGVLVPKDKSDSELLEDVTTSISELECVWCGEFGAGCTCDPKLRQYDNHGSRGLLGVTTASGGLVKPKAPTPSKYSINYPSGTSAYGGEWAGKVWCDHWRDKVELAEGITVLCSAFLERPTNITWEPDIGIYLSDWWVRGRTLVTHSWGGPRFYGRCEMALVDWPDMYTPGLRQTSETIAALDYGLNQAAKGRDVEIGCHGGHGRTGCALAICMMLLGHDAETSMKYVWKNYCNQAIETLKQEEWLEEVAYEMVQEFLTGRKPA